MTSLLLTQQQKHPLLSAIILGALSTVALPKINLKTKTTSQTIVYNICYTE